MNTEQYQRPLQSNFVAVQKCWVFRKDRPERIPKSKLPDPRTTRLRMEIAMMRADIARPAWNVDYRIRQIEARLAELAGH